LTIGKKQEYENGISVSFQIGLRALDRFISEKALLDAADGVFFLGGKLGKSAIEANELPELYHGFQR